MIRDSGKRCASLSCLGLVSWGSACGFSIHLQCGFQLLLYSYICIGAPPLLYPAAPPSFSPPANDAIPLRLALFNVCLAPCAGRAESVYHIIDGTGKETVRKCRFGNWHISETERLAARLAMEMYMSVRIVACIAARNGTMASAQFVSDAIRPVLDDMDQPGGSEQSQGA